MRPATRLPERSSTAPTGPASKPLPYAVKVTLEAEDYDALLELARQQLRRPDWQASYLLRRAIADALRAGAGDAA